MENRREFIKKVSAGMAAVAIGGTRFDLSARSYSRIPGANEKIRVGVVGFSDRFRSSLLPSFMDHAEKLNFELVSLSDIWNRRREEGKAYIRQKTGW
ncbi:MAG TPA: oxidoreductase, partial [Porphyromonadaceae bacterium]|nr:oxidoreductase [Porphyromonadaceae bacterium]